MGMDEKEYMCLISSADEVDHNAINTDINNVS